MFKIVAEIVRLIDFRYIYMLKRIWNFLWERLPLDWCISAFYPRMIYRKPYKNAKDNSQTTHFAFLKIICRKKQNHINEYKYDDIQKVLETGKYFSYFTIRKCDIVDKRLTLTEMSKVFRVYKNKDTI